MSKRILVVDDDKLLREVVADFLERSGYETVMAESGDEALQQFSPQSFDLALVDLVMPGMNGLELMQKLFEQDSSLFIIIMTGYPTVDSAYKAMIDGVSDYVIKPFRFDELLQTVMKHIGR